MRNTSHIVSLSAEETLRIGAELGERLLPGDALLLTGDLGAGKTTLTQGIAMGLGVVERPRSPTFVMATEYHGRLPLYHLDLYRVDHLGELGELGLDEYMKRRWRHRRRVGRSRAARLPGARHMDRPAVYR